MIRRKAILTSALTLALVAGAATAANAATINTYVSDYRAGTPTTARIATQSTQSIKLSNCVWSTQTGTGNPASKSQWQLQTPNAFGAWTAVSDKNQTCNSSAASWSGSAGSQYRYQYNGCYDQYGNWVGSGFLFSADPVVINY